MKTFISPCVRFYGKSFSSFHKGVRALSRVSESALQSMCCSIDCKSHRENIPCEDVEDDGCPFLNGEAVDRYGVSLLEQAVTASLLNNVYYAVTNPPDIRVTPAGIGYVTSGGLKFGWTRERISSCDYRYAFYVGHPDGEFPEESTLRESALEEGWEDCSDMVPYFLGAEEQE